MSTRKNGFTIVELLIVIVVISVLAGIAIVSYNGIAQRARNEARVSAANSLMKAILIADVRSVLDYIPAGTIGRFCLSDQVGDTDGNGVLDCGEVNGAKVGTYSGDLVAALKSVATTLPVGPPVAVWSPTIYKGPTLEIAHDWSDERGEPARYILHYWLEGSSQNCRMATVVFDYSALPVPEGMPGATAVIRPSGGSYLYADSQATYCYVRVA